MTSSWLETIAQRVDMTPTQAEIALRKRGITADRPLRPARTLTITSIAFKGEKRGSGHGTIDFAWSDLKPGIWAVTSEKKSRGQIECARNYTVVPARCAQRPSGRCPQMAELGRDDFPRRRVGLSDRVQSRGRCAEGKSLTLATRWRYRGRIGSILHRRWICCCHVTIHDEHVGS